MMINRSPTSQEQYVFMGNNTRDQVVSLGIVRLHLNAEKNIYFFFLQNVAYIPSLE